MWRELQYLDEHGRRIRHLQRERTEQALAYAYVEAADCVLELGARYGTVSCAANLKLARRTDHVVVEPDETVWAALEANRARNRCEFHVVRGFVSRQPLGLCGEGYGTQSRPDAASAVPCHTLEAVCERFGGLRFTALLADCEGFLETFLEENPSLLDSLRLVIFEKDNPARCNYRRVKKALRERGFAQLVGRFREVWARPPPPGADSPRQ
jgi:FkbM family methyltransferase